jgi:hypothetical protein
MLPFRCGKTIIPPSRRIDNLRAAGIEDFRAYFDDCPQAVAECAVLVKVVNVNRATLDLYRAAALEDFQAGLPGIFGEQSYDSFREDLARLAEGTYAFEGENINTTLTGERIHDGG